MNRLKRKGKNSIYGSFKNKNQVPGNKLNKPLKKEVEEDYRRWERTPMLMD
jgi:hypothetical protein